LFSLCSVIDSAYHPERTRTEPITRLVFVGCWGWKCARRGIFEPNRPVRKHNDDWYRDTRWRPLGRRFAGLDDRGSVW